MTNLTRDDVVNELRQRVRELEGENARLLGRASSLGNRLAQLEVQRALENNARNLEGTGVSAVAAALLEAVAQADREMAIGGSDAGFTIVRLEAELPGIVTSTAHEVFFKPADTVAQGVQRGALRLTIAKMPVNDVST
jgi:predicted RNase H-like nuclease (RuvC/YqgF family)